MIYLLISSTELCKNLRIFSVQFNSHFHASCEAVKEDFVREQGKDPNVVTHTSASSLFSESYFCLLMAVAPLTLILLKKLMCILIHYRECLPILRTPVALIVGHTHTQPPQHLILFHLFESCSYILF